MSTCLQTTLNNTLDIPHNAAVVNFSGTILNYETVNTHPRSTVAPAGQSLQLRTYIYHISSLRQVAITSL